MSNKKYNILLVHNFYQKPGGEDTVFYNEKKLLEDNGHKVFTYTRDNKDLNKFNIIKKIFLPIIIIFNFKTYLDIKKIIKDNNIDIVHVHNTLSLISPSVFYAAVKMKKPVVQTLHNFRMQCPSALFYRDGHICEDCVKYGLMSALKHKCYRNSFIQTLAIVIMTKIHRLTGIYKKVNFICLTEFNKSKLLLINKKKEIVDSNKIFVKPNFVFDENDNDKKLENTSKKENNGYYLYVGRLDEIKGIDTVLLAFSKMPDRELHVIGSGGEEYIKEYSRYANIKFLGQLSHDNVMREMREGTALVFASKWYEGMPMAIIESFEQSLPVISCNLGNANELVVDGITGLHFEMGSVASLINIVDKFEVVLFDKTMRFNARNEYMRKYNHFVGDDNVKAIYEEIFNAK